MGKKVYGYIRVSSRDQKVERQLVAMREIGLTRKQVYIDKQSGKDFERPAYQRLRSLMQEGDLLYVQSLDRLGRNYEEMIEEWRQLTKNKKIDICVLDMPLLDTRIEKNFMGSFVSDLVLQLLSFFAEMERRSIKERQAQGIQAAKAKGVKFGRPRAKVPECYDEVVALYLEKKLTLKDAAEKVGLSTVTLRRRVKQEKK